MKYLQYGGAKCKLCKSQGTTLTKCPWNPEAILSGTTNVKLHRNTIGRKGLTIYLVARRGLLTKIEELKAEGNDEDAAKLQDVYDNGVQNKAIKTRKSAKKPKPAPAKKPAPVEKTKPVPAKKQKPKPVPAQKQKPKPVPAKQPKSVTQPTSLSDEGGGAKVHSESESESSDEASVNYMTINVHDIGATLQKIQIIIEGERLKFRIGLPYPDNAERQFHNLYKYSTTSNDELLVKGRCVINKTTKKLDVQLIAT